MLYGTRTAGARQASSHPEIAENAGNRDNTVHSSCSRGACVVKCVGMAPQSCVVWRSYSHVELSRLQFVSAFVFHLSAISIRLGGDLPTNLLVNVPCVHSTSPKTTPFGARPATRNTKKRENATRDSGSVPVTATAQVTVSALLLLSTMIIFLGGGWGLPGLDQGGLQLVRRSISARADLYRIPRR